MKYQLYEPRVRTEFRHRAYTLVEMIVIVAILGFVSMVVYPLGVEMLARNRVEGFLQEVTSTLTRAKGDAVRFGVPVVVRADYENRMLVAFADYNDADGDSGSDLLYNPAVDLDTGVVGPFGSADREVAMIQLPDAPVFARQVHFWAFEDDAPGGDNALDGFTDAPVGDGADPQPPLIVFEPDGSIRDVGGIRFGIGPEIRADSTDGNFYEIRIEPAATALFEIRKYIAEPPGQAGFYPRSTTPGSINWQWY